MGVDLIHIISFETYYLASFAHSGKELISARYDWDVQLPHKPIFRQKANPLTLDWFAL